MKKSPAGAGVLSVPRSRMPRLPRRSHDPKDVDLQVQGNTLTISGERSTTHETNEADYLRREITYGSFQRSILLPEGVDKDKLNAEYRNGILEITAPIATAALPRKGEIKALPGAAAKHAGA